VAPGKAALQPLRGFWHNSRVTGPSQLQPVSAKDSCGNRNSPKETMRNAMQVFSLSREAEWDPKKHVEKILGTIGEGDVTVACWEPGQISPNHCHPYATEIYFCFEGGGTMRTPGETIAVTPGSFVVHPPGEVHEYENGAARTLLFRVRYGADMAARHVIWRGRDGWKQSAEDAAYYRANPPR
jgi:quercetin dioxygenase-like cupin family protein